jgi:hypothetical protein
MDGTLALSSLYSFVKDIIERDLSVALDSPVAGCSASRVCELAPGVTAGWFWPFSVTVGRGEIYL